jgi:hypothetical protein
MTKDQQGLYGRLPADPSAPRISIDPLYAAIAAVYPASEDNLTGVPLAMDGNDQWSNCVVVACKNHFVVTWMKLFPGVPVPVITEKNCIDAYKAASGDTAPPGGGLITEKFLTWLVKNGLAGQKPIMWCSLSDLWDSDAQVDYEFVAGIYGVEIDAAQTYSYSSAHGWVWDDVIGSALQGYHETCGGAYDSAYLKCATWAKVAKMTRSYVGAKLNEHHVIVWQHIWDQLSWVRQTDLAARYLAVTGRVVPVTATPPPLSPEAIMVDPGILSPIPRILDTRIALGLTGPIAAHTSHALQVAGVAGIPTNAISVRGNLTVTQQTAMGYLAVGDRSTLPAVEPPNSSLNFPKGDDRANFVECPLDASGKMWIAFESPTAGATCQAIFDPSGFSIAAP